MSSNRNLSGLFSSSSNRNLSGLTTDNTYTATSPLLINNTNVISLSESLFNTETNLNNSDTLLFIDTTGNYDKITFSNLKSLIPDTNTEYTLQSPLSFISANKIQIQQSLFNISTSLVDLDFIPIFDTNGNFDKITFSNFKSLIPDTNTQYTLLSPLSFVGSTTQIQIDQSLFNSQTILNNGDFFPYFDTAGNFDKITFLNIKTSINYQGTSPIVADNTNFVYDLDFSGLSDFGEGDIGDTAEFILSTDGVKTFRALKFSKLKSQIQSYSVVSPLALSGTQISLSQSLFNIQTILNNGDFCPYFDTAGNFDRITMSNMRNYMTTQAINFGTDGSTSGQRVFGNAGREAEITGTEIIITNGADRLEINTDGSLKYKDSSKTLFMVKPLQTAIDSDNFAVGCPSFMRTIAINNTAAQNQWNNLITFRRASNSISQAFSQAVYDYTESGVDINLYYGLFSNQSVGTNSGTTPIIEVRGDGQIVFNADLTVASPMPNNSVLVAQTRYSPLISGSTYLSKYMPYIYFGLAHSNKSEAFIRWTYSTATGLNYCGFNYGTNSGSTDIMSLASNGNMAILGSYGSSDKRIKKDIIDADLDECITVMKSIKLKKYKYTDAYQETYSTTKKEVYGFLADDILENEYLDYCGEISDMPKTLSSGEVLHDFKTIEKSKILSVLWGCCNKQQNKIEEQQTEIELLKSEIENIKSHLNL